MKGNTVQGKQKSKKSKKKRSQKRSRKREFKKSKKRSQSKKKVNPTFVNKKKGILIVNNIFLFCWKISLQYCEFEFN